MSHLILRQTTNSTELVDSSCINDLYLLTIGHVLDSTSNLEGKINTASTSKDKVNALHTLDEYNNPVLTENAGAWDNLYVTSTLYSFEFADQVLKQLLVQKVYGGKDPTEQDVANTSTQWSTNPYCTDAYPYLMRSGLFLNTQIETFDELRYFTKAGSIGGLMFANCTKLKSVTMPPPVSGYTYEIGWLAFQNCNSLESLTLPFGQLVLLNGSSGIPQTTKIYVPASMVETYKTASNWSNYASNIYAIE